LHVHHDEPRPPKRWPAGLAISERAYQQARQYAKDRLQGTRKDGSRFSIIHFPDVRRMLLQMKASIEAMRALALVAAAEVDRTAHAPDADTAKVHQGRVDLLTPIVKGWLTEMAQEVTSLGVQIHGGMGFIEETGAAQHYRDARILTIYEGTTGIQALDLVGRKTLLNQGELLTRLLDEIGETVALLQGSATLAHQAKALDDALCAGRAACACYSTMPKRCPPGGQHQRQFHDAVRLPEWRLVDGPLGTQCSSPAGLGQW
jgi:hypothetical protein